MAIIYKWFGTSFVYFKMCVLLFGQGLLFLLMFGLVDSNLEQSQTTTEKTNYDQKTKPIY